MRHPALILALLTGIISTATAQSFYVNAYEPIPERNNTSVLNIRNSADDQLPYCGPTPSTTPGAMMFSDMAADKEGNLWYVTSYGDLYKRRKPPYSSSCSFIGTFPNQSVNALVADSAGTLYAVGAHNGTTRLLSFDGTGVFTILGTLPPNISSAGDLFFYRHRLFLTGATALIELTLPDLSQSCSYMDLRGIRAYAAFAVRDSTGADEVYILDTHSFTSTPYTELLRVDMDRRRIADTIRRYNMEITGAAAYYAATGTADTCTPYDPTAITTATGAAQQQYLQVLHPSRDVIRVHTNLTANDITAISLFDVSGRQVARFDAGAINTGMDVSYLGNGIYTLRVATRMGKVHVQKMVKGN